MDIVELKKCNRCEKLLPISYFYKNKRTISGLTSVCKICFNTTNKKSYLNNREKRLAEMKRWRKKNKDRKRELYKLWVMKNPEYAKEYRETHRKITKPKLTKEEIIYNKKARKSVERRNRKLQLKQIPGKHTKKDIDNLLKLQKNKCPICHSKFSTTSFHVDHIVPISRNGTNYPENLQLLCPNCNIKKSNKIPEAFMRENGFLL